MAEFWLYVLNVGGWVFLGLGVCIGSGALMTYLLRQKNPWLKAAGYGLVFLLASMLFAMYLWVTIVLPLKAGA